MLSSVLPLLLTRSDSLNSRFTPPLRSYQRKLAKYHSGNQPGAWRGDGIEGAIGTEGVTRQQRRALARGK